MIAGTWYFHTKNIVRLAINAMLSITIYMRRFVSGLQSSKSHSLPWDCHSHAHFHRRNTPVSQKASRIETNRYANFG